MTTTIELFSKITAGLIDNARNNGVPLTEGWNPDLAIETYCSDAEIDALTAAEYGELQTQLKSILSPNANADQIIRQHLFEAGYSEADALYGLEYARAQGPYTAREGYILALSRILYDDGQLADGARFGVADGCGPQ